MGITGLLQGLKPFTKNQNVSDFSRQALAIDTSSWLHRSVYSIADLYVEAMEEKGRHCHDPTCIETSATYIVNRCRELFMYAHVSKLFLVMDGKRCPLKAPTNQDREQKRQQALAEARASRHAGSNQRKLFEKYKACIKISADFAQVVMERVMKKLRSNQNVHMVHSPYEADAQLVELCVNGLAQAIVTEDSDVLLYSAACRSSFPVLFKLDRNSGSCQVLSMSWLLDLQHNQQLSRHYQSSAITNVTALELILLNWMQQEQRHPSQGARFFVQACILAGCDYAPRQLAGVGLVNAFKLVDRLRHVSHEQRFRTILKQHRSSSSSSSLRQNKIDLRDYETLLAQAEAVFYYHPVHKDNLQQVNYLNSIQTENNHTPRLDRFGSDLEFLGCVDDRICHPSVGVVDNNQPHSFAVLEISSLPPQPPPPPVAEIVVREGRKRKRPPCEKSGENEGQPKPIVNPYLRKRSDAAAEKQQQHCTPLLPQSNNTNRRKQVHCNTDEKHRHSRGKDNNRHSRCKENDGSKEKRSICHPTADTEVQKKDDNCSIAQSKIRDYLRNNKPASKRRDIRFVKPKFGKDGSRLDQSKPPPVENTENTDMASRASPKREIASAKKLVFTSLGESSEVESTTASGPSRLDGSESGADNAVHREVISMAAPFFEGSTTSTHEDSHAMDSSLHHQQGRQANWETPAGIPKLGQGGGPEVAEPNLLLPDSDREDEVLEEISPTQPPLQREPMAANFSRQINESQNQVEHDISFRASCAVKCENQGAAVSKYFSGGGSDDEGRHLARRVTLDDSPCREIQDQSEISVEQPVFLVDVPGAAFYDLYDDFLSPKKATEQDKDLVETIDDIEEDSPDVGSRVRPITFDLEPPKPQSSIGPAKKLRNRFGPIRVGTQNDHRPPLAELNQGRLNETQFTGNPHHESVHSSSWRRTEMFSRNIDDSDEPWFSSSSSLTGQSRSAPPPKSLYHHPPSRACIKSRPRNSLHFYFSSSKSKKEAT